MKKLLFIITAIVLLSCNDTADKKTAETKFDIVPVKAHIVEMNKSYGQRFTTNDSLYYLERYCKDAVVMGSQSPAVYGRDSIRNYFYSGGKNTELIIELPTGDIYGSADLVVEEGRYNFPDGKGGSFDKGKFIALWKQEDGKWKLYREIWNSDLPPAPAK